MKLRRNKFTTFLLLAYAWLCCCCMDCPFDEGYGFFQGVEARKPVGVDSLEMRVMYKDSLLAKEFSRPIENGDAAYYDYSVCDSLVLDEVCNLDITISFYCGGKKIELPPYTAQINVNKSGYLDYILFVFTEFDERNISGHYSVEKFLPPQDTSCGKFVNYAVLKVD